jgi:hypothetical protein
MTIIDINPRNPFRPPDWRWRRALHLYERRAKPHSRRDDHWTRLALRLIERIDAGGIPRGRRRTGTDVVLDEAHRLKFADDPRGCWEAEARVLAGQEPAAIAACLGISPDAVEAFGALFFDLAGRLEQIDYLAAHVFGPGLYRGIDPDDLGAVVRLVGYNTGPGAVDALVGVWGWPSAARLAPLPAAETMAMRRTVDLLVASLSLRVDGSDALTFKKLNRLAKDIDRASSARSIAPISTPATVAGASPLIADPIDRDDVSSLPSMGSDILEFVMHPLSTCFETSAAELPLAAVG